MKRLEPTTTPLCPERHIQVRGAMLMGVPPALARGAGSVRWVGSPFVRLFGRWER